MQKLVSEKQFKELVSSGQTVISVFKTTWCKDCHYLDLFMDSIEQNYASMVTFIEVDLDEFPKLSSEYMVLGIPSFISFKNGQEITRFVSKLRKEKAEIEQYVKQTIRVSDALQ